MVIKGNQDMQEKCYKLTLLSSIFNNLIVLSSNSLYILINVKTVIKNKDFSRIKISDISFSYSNFIECNFSDSKFERVVINGLHLSKSNLTRINWKDIQSNDLPSYKNKINISYISFSYDEK